MCVCIYIYIYIYIYIIYIYIYIYKPFGDDVSTRVYLSYTNYPFSFLQQECNNSNCFNRSVEISLVLEMQQLVQ